MNGFQKPIETQFFHNLIDMLHVAELDLLFLKIQTLARYSKLLHELEQNNISSLFLRLIVIIIIIVYFQNDGHRDLKNIEKFHASLVILQLNVL